MQNEALGEMGAENYLIHGLPKEEMERELLDVLKRVRAHLTCCASQEDRLCCQGSYGARVAGCAEEGYWHNASCWMC